MVIHDIRNPASQINFTIGKAMSILMACHQQNQDYYKRVMSHMFKFKASYFEQMEVLHRLCVHTDDLYKE